MKHKLCCLVRGCWQCGHCKSIFCYPCVDKMEERPKDVYVIVICPNCGGDSEWVCINEFIDAQDRQELM